MRRHKKKLVVLICVSVAVLLSCFLGTRFFRTREIEFDSELWKSQTWPDGVTDSVNPRAVMVDHLVRERLRVRMTRNEVLDLLGEPDGPGTRDHSAFWYSLPGYAGGWPIRRDAGLVLGFDQDGNLKDIVIRCD